MMQVDYLLRMAYLKAVHAQLSDREKKLETWRKFYAGEQGIKLTDRQREYIGAIGGELENAALCNICRRAVEIPLERLSVESITAPNDDDTFAQLAAAWWDANDLESWQHDVYEYALRDGASCLLIGYDGEKPTYTLHQLYDGRNGHIRLHYDGDTGDLIFASKRYRMWDAATMTDSGVTRLTLYFNDRIERYESSAASADGWRLLSESEVGMMNPQPWVDRRGQPLGIPVAVFENPNGSELNDLLLSQQAVNKSLTDMLAAQDLHGWPLLVLRGYKRVLSDDGTPTPLDYQPGKAIVVPSDGGVDRVSGVDLTKMYEAGVLSWVQLASLVKGWPVFLWMRGEPPSGESLKVMESSLVSQVVRKQDGFGDSWKYALTMGARLHELATGQYPTGEIDLNWVDPNTRNEPDMWNALKTKWEAAQVPIPQRWREAGYSEEEIMRMEAEQQGALMDMAQQSVLAALMAQRTGTTIAAPAQQFGGGIETT